MAPPGDGSPGNATEGAPVVPPPRTGPAAESGLSAAVGWAGTVGPAVGATLAGPATPDAADAPPPWRPERLPRPFLAPWAGPAVLPDAVPRSPSAARAWDMRMASIVMSWRISERLQARSASSHMVVRCRGLVPVTSARAMMAPFGASSRPFRYRSQDVLL